MVVLANHPRREYVEGPVFNVSSRRFETVDTIARALVAEYHMKYVDSSFFYRPRRIKDVQPLFTEALHLY